MSARTSKRSSATRRSKSPDDLPGEQPGLRRIVQQRLLKDVFESTASKLSLLLHLLRCDCAFAPASSKDSNEMGRSWWCAPC